jgi:hypothetical protein
VRERAAVYIRRVMHGRHRSLRELIGRLRLTPDEARDVHAEECMEALFDRERCACLDLGERELAEVEAERRRWAGPQGSNETMTRSSTPR